MKLFTYLATLGLVSAIVVHAGTPPSPAALGVPTLLYAAHAPDFVMDAVRIQAAAKNERRTIDEYMTRNRGEMFGDVADAGVVRTAIDTIRGLSTTYPVDAVAVRVRGILVASRAVDGGWELRAPSRTRAQRPPPNELVYRHIGSPQRVTSEWEEFAEYDSKNPCRRLLRYLPMDSVSAKRWRGEFEHRRDSILKDFPARRPSDPDAVGPFVIADVDFGYRPSPGPNGGYECHVLQVVLVDPISRSVLTSVRDDGTKPELPADYDAREREAQSSNSVPPTYPSK